MLCNNLNYSSLLSVVLSGVAYGDHTHRRGHVLVRAVIINYPHYSIAGFATFLGELCTRIHVVKFENSFEFKCQSVVDT